MHSAKKLRSNRIPGSGPYDGVNWTLGAQCGPALIDPIIDFTRRKDCEAIKAAATRTFLQFSAIVDGMLVGQLVILIGTKRVQSEPRHVKYFK